MLWGPRNRGKLILSEIGIALSKEFPELREFKQVRVAELASSCCYPVSDSLPHPYLPKIFPPFASLLTGGGWEFAHEKCFNKFSWQILGRCWGLGALQQCQLAYGSSLAQCGSYMRQPMHDDQACFGWCTAQPRPFQTIPPWWPLSTRCLP